ncbi:unannotated protein [freshwater metagenome]|uniref:Unannotated protein n=1 Tax=freshwater metagenome TaxID=449393 RepID=A0A6J7RWQ4_9ZZZZ
MWAHGSSVTTSVPPFAFSPAASSATISAWRRPGDSVAPSKRCVVSPETRTAPTQGFGAVICRIVAAIDIARSMSSNSAGAGALMSLQC